MGFMDFFKPHWKHSNPSVRAAAIRSLEEDQQGVLLDMALEDDDAGNRLAAARRVKDDELLRKLRDQSQDKNIQDLARKQLLESMAAAAKAPADGEAGVTQARAALEELKGDQRILEDVARNARSLEIRRLVLPKLVHAGAFQAVAMHEEDSQLAMQALEKVTKESHLESLAKGARNKTVRAAAKDRLKALAAGRVPDAAAVNRAKLNLVLSTVEKAAAAETPLGYPWDIVKEQVDGAEHALSELMAAGTAPDPARLARFREEAARFRARYDRHEQERAAREKREREAAENRRLKEEICEQLETLWNGERDGDEGIHGEVRRLREGWQGLGFCGEEDEEALQKRFRGIVDKLERDREKKARDKEMQARRQADAQEHGARMAAMASEAETLAGEAAGRPGSVSARLRDLRREWNRAQGESGDFDGKEALRARFDAALASSNQALDKSRERNLERMRDLLPQLEALLEDPDMLEAERRFKSLNGEWKSLLPAPSGLEAEGLQGRYQAFIDRFREAQDWLRWSNLRAKQGICERLDALSNEEVGKSVVARLKELQAEWKALGPVPWDSSEALWDRYHQVCDGLYEKCREYFAELDVERESNLKAKEELCARVEVLATAEDLDWREAMDTFKESQGAWKTIGAVPKAQSEALWTRFRAACSTFFEKKDSYNRSNLDRKLELVALAESLQDSTEWKSAGAQIKEAQEKWKAIGPVPKDQAEPIWARFHGACERFFQARRAHLDQLEQERPLNLAKKEELCRLVETLEELPGDGERFERIRQAQAAWKETGPVPREMEDALWERFRKPIDAYFEGRKGRLEEERKHRDENAQIKEDICVEAESLTGSTEWKATIDKIKALQERWKATGPAPRESDQRLWRRFRGACDAFFDRLKENSAQRDQDRMGSLKMKEDLCFLAEMLSSREPTEEEARARASWQTERMREDFGRFRQKPGAPNWQDTIDKVKALQREWKSIGPVPKDMSDVIWERFHQACDAVFEERRQALGMPAEDPQVNLEKKLEIIAEAESLSGRSGEAVLQKVRVLQRDWRRIGPVPRAQSDYVWQRFNDACNHALEDAAGPEARGSGEGAGGRAEAEPEPAG